METIDGPGAISARFGIFIMIIDDKYTQLGIVLKYQSGYNDRGKNVRI